MKNSLEVLVVMLQAIDCQGLFFSLPLPLVNCLESPLDRKKPVTEEHITSDYKFAQGWRLSQLK